MEGVKGVGPGGPHDHASGPEQNSGPGPEQNSGPGPEQDGGPGRPKAENPADLARLFLDRANAGDVAGVVALYEADAVLAFPPGQITVGAFPGLTRQSLLHVHVLRAGGRNDVVRDGRPGWGPVPVERGRPVAQELLVQGMLRPSRGPMALL